MRKIHSVFAFCFLVFSFIAVASSQVTAEELVDYARPDMGFSMKVPKGWHEGDNQTTMKNLDEFKFDPKELDKILDSHKGSLFIANFHKFKPDEYNGIIPTINVFLKNNPTESFNSFMRSMEMSSSSMKKVLKEYTEVTKPQKVQIDGVNTVFFESSFIVKGKNGNDYKVISQTYAIPQGRHFYQVNFSEEVKNENKDLFDQMAKSVKVYN